MTRARRGLSLLELMVVLVILALTAAVATPAFTSAANRGAMSDAMATVTRVLDGARATALTQGRSVSLTIDPVHTRIWQTVPDTTFTLSLPERCSLRGPRDRVRATFRADGSASSDAIVVQCGTSAVAVSIAAFGGAVRTAGGQ